jgi:hypothetical protein
LVDCSVSLNEIVLRPVPVLFQIAVKLGVKKEAMQDYFTRLLKGRPIVL